MSEATLLDQFIIWGEGLAELPNIDAEIEIARCTPTDNPAARIDFGGSEFMGRITLWSDGSFFAEALHMKSEEHIITRHGVVATYHKFDHEFMDILHLFRTVR